MRDREDRYEMPGNDERDKERKESAGHGLMNRHTFGPLGASVSSLGLSLSWVALSPLPFTTPPASPC